MRVNHISPYLVVMQDHFELVEEIPALSLFVIEVMVEISGCESKGMEMLVGRQQKYCGSLLIIHSRIVT